MKKFISVLLSAHLFSNAGIKDNDTVAVEVERRCSETMTFYNIDYNIKSPKGWKRVCLNKRLYLYTDKAITDKIRNKLCSCLVGEYKNRDVQIVRKVDK